MQGTQSTDTTQPAAARSTADTVIEARNVSRRFGDVLALDGITLSVPRGVIYGLLGPSGSGKTTFIRILAGALRASGGSVTVLGRPQPSRDNAARIGYMTQTAALYPDLSLRENLEFFGALYGLEGRALTSRIEQLAEEVGLADRLGSPLHTFSGGMRQRASLGCALLHDPELLFLDEPTVGLDPVLRRAFWQRFRGLADAGRTLVVSSHVMDEAERCDLLGFVRDGRLLASDSPAALRRLTGRDNLEDAFLVLAGEPAAVIEGGAR
ncbi:MAG TPA: ABC transporter ATP-binding protein [Thermomicrobiaceae bacterium]|nr:ABC transporter ATP-binding protein [Thermomicrobiaceae bacterium]